MNLTNYFTYTVLNMFDHQKFTTATCLSQDHALIRDAALSSVYYYYPAVVSESAMYTLYDTKKRLNPFTSE